MSLSSPQPCPTNALWVSVSPSFQPLHAKLLHQLNRHTPVAQWAYDQTADEPCSLESAITLLHDYLKTQPQPVHLLGHSISGWVALRYAQRHPHRVKSLTLLGVGVTPSVDWQALYYCQLAHTLRPRQAVLTQMAHSLFGHLARPLVAGWVRRLEQDLACSPSPHSLLSRGHLCPQRVSVPLLVCGGRDDVVVPPTQLWGWQPWLKVGDQVWECPGGRHFFHAAYAQQVTEQITQFWASSAVPAPLLTA